MNVSTLGFWCYLPSYAGWNDYGDRKKSKMTPGSRGRGRCTVSWILGSWRHKPEVGVLCDWLAAGSSLFMDMSHAYFSDVPSWTHWPVQYRILGMVSVSVVINSMMTVPLWISKPRPHPTCPTVVLRFGTPSYENLQRLQRFHISRRGQWEPWAY